MDREKMKEFGAVLVGGPLGYAAYKNKDKIARKGNAIVSAVKPIIKKAARDADITKSAIKYTGERLVNRHSPVGVVKAGYGLIKDKLAERKSNKTRAEVNEKAAESLGNRGRYKVEHIIPLKSGGADNNENKRLLPKILKK